MLNLSETRSIAIVGAGPAGLMAAQAICEAVTSQRNMPRIDLYDAMPSIGRKFLLAGKGGLNLTHAEAPDHFITRYGDRQTEVARLLAHFDAQSMRDWALKLGIETFVGTSNRVFPTELKAAPLLRAWLSQLKKYGVRVHARHRLLGIDIGIGFQHPATSRPCLTFQAPNGNVAVEADATILALGGASWKHLGSDGAWVPWLAAMGADIAPLEPANCGFDRSEPWSEHLQTRFAGQPIKTAAISFTDSDGHTFDRQGEFVLTQTGLEGSLIYAVSSMIRREITRTGKATIYIDLLPDRSFEQVCEKLAQPRGSKTLSNHLQSKLGLKGLKTALLYELVPKALMQSNQFNSEQALTLAQIIKNLPVSLSAPRPIDEAISTAGGIRFKSMNNALMLNQLPGIFCAGEMLDWEAPTGGYLLTAVMASGLVAGRGALSWIQKEQT